MITCIDTTLYNEQKTQNKPQIIYCKKQFNFAGAGYPKTNTYSAGGKRCNYWPWNAQIQSGYELGTAGQITIPGQGLS